MATSKVKNCFNSFTTEEFDRIEAIAQHLAKAAGREGHPINADYIEVAEGLKSHAETKLSKILDAHKAEVEASAKQSADKAEAEKAAHDAKQKADLEEAADTSKKASDYDAKVNPDELIESVESAKGDVELQGAINELYKAYIEAPEGSNALAKLEEYIDENYKSKSFADAILFAEKMNSDRDNFGFGRSAEGTKSKVSKDTIDVMKNLATPKWSMADEEVPSDKQMSQAQLQSIVDGLGLTDPSIVNIADSATSVANDVPTGTTPAGGVVGGKIFLFRNGLRDADHAIRTVFHELFHFGLKNVLPKEKYIQHMLRLLNKDAKVAEYAKRWRGTAEGVQKKGTMPTQDWHALSAEEALADIAEELNTGDKMGSQMKGTVRSIASWMADTADMLGLKKLAQAIRRMSYSDAEKFVIDTIGTVRGTQQEASEQSKFSTSRDQVDGIQSKIKEGIEKLQGTEAASVAVSVSHAVKKLVSKMRFLHDLVNSVEKALPSAKVWYKHVMDSMNTRKELDERADRIYIDSQKLKGGTAKVNQFLADSTLMGKWGYEPEYRHKVETDPELVRRFNEDLSPEEREVVKAVFKHGEDMANLRIKTLSDLGLEKSLGTSMAKIDGPYAPLKRFGDYWAVLKSQDYLDAEEAGDEKEMERLKQDPKHYIASTFDTMGQARQFARANDKEHGGEFPWTDSWEKSERTDTTRTMRQDVLSKVLAAVKADSPDMTDEQKKVRDGIQQMITNMYFQSLDEHNARVAGARRLKVAGFDQDMIRSFVSNAKAESSMIANLKHGALINDAFYKMGNEIKNDRNKRVNQDAYNAIAAHYASSMDYKETPWQDRMMAWTSAWQLATSIGYHVANATQPFMVTAPMLAADFDDYQGALNHVYDAYKMLKVTGIKGNLKIGDIQDKGLREMLEQASKDGLIDVGMDEDLTSLNRSRTGIEAVDRISAKAASAMHKLRSVSRMVETANRIAAGVAAYNMARENKMNHEQATDYAVKVLRDTQGDTSRMNSPLIFKKVPKFLMQYKRFQFMTAALYAKAFHQMFNGASDEEKAIGRRMLAYKMFHTTLGAGVLGWPLMNLAKMVFGMLGKDDEPKDLERSLREWIGDPDMANMLLHGPLSLIGLDMSAKLDDSNAFSIMPYGEWDFTSSKGIKDTVFNLAGPAASQAAKFADGVGLMMKGDYYKGLEKLMPTGAANAIKATRIYNEGYTLKNGDVMFKPEDINGAMLAMDALGLPTSEMKRMEWIRSQAYEINDFYHKKTSEIEQSYEKAVKSQDADGMQEARDKWKSLQDAKRELAGFYETTPSFLKPTPMSQLLKYPNSVESRQKKLQRNSKLDI